MATTHRSTRSRLAVLSSDRLEELCWIASGELAPCKRFEALARDVLAERQSHTAASCPVWMKASRLPF
jgi:hypothetical protein